MEIPTDRERMIKVEVTQGFHAQRIGLLENQYSHLNKALGAIQDNLTQIKWLAIGSAVGWLLHEIGVLELVKGLIL